MQDDEFEWDDGKAAANLAKHKVGFEAASRVFIDDTVIFGEDDSSSDDEDRYFATGHVEGRLLTVFYTYRGERIRIISARPATKRESDDYYRG